MRSELLKVVDIVLVEAKAGVLVPMFRLLLGLVVDEFATERSDIPRDDPKGKGEYGDCLNGGDDPSPSIFVFKPVKLTTQSSQRTFAKLCFNLVLLIFNIS